MTTMKFSPLIKQEIPEDLEDNPAWSAIGGLGYDAINQRYLVVDWHQYGASSFALNGATILAANGTTPFAPNRST